MRTPFEKPKTKQYMIENFKKSQLPLGKDEVNMKTSFLMYVFFDLGKSIESINPRFV